jgi:phosphoglycolate phosphatase
VNLLFDLDGTLTDPGVGITRCIQHALAGMGRRVPAMDDLLRFVGPPLRCTFEELLETHDDAQLDEAIRLYRSRFGAIGILENVLYPDVPSVLADLGAAGHRLWVVTSKPHLFARRIVDHFGLGSLFERTYGSELSGENADKTDLIRIVLEREGLAARDTWMIGDRAQDIVAARANGVASVAALWGYGTREELRSAGPDWLAGSIGELRRWAA